MATENLPPEAVSGGIGALIVGALLVVKKFFGADGPPHEKREELRRENDRFNELVVKNLTSSIDHLADIIKINTAHQEEFKQDFKEEMNEFKTTINERFKEFKEEVREDIRDLKGRSN